MPTIQCPHCKHEARVPSLDKIGGKNVKCPACDQTFHVESQPPEPPRPDANEFAFRGPVPEFSPPQAPPAKPSKRRRRAKSFFRPLTYDPKGATSAKRYPNLTRYLHTTERLITAWFKTTMMLIALFFVLGELGCLFYGIREVGLLQAVLIMLLCPVLAIIAAMQVWLLYILYMAILEFLRVVVDIENNTRH